jgi:hypothetical protein
MKVSYGRERSRLGTAASEYIKFPVSSHQKMSAIAPTRDLCPCNRYVAELGGVLRCEALLPH